MHVADVSTGIGFKKNRGRNRAYTCGSLSIILAVFMEYPWDKCKNRGLMIRPLFSIR
jgi:hypothetical protein